MMKKIMIVGGIAVVALVVLTAAGVSVRQLAKHAVNRIQSETAPSTEEKLSDLRKEVGKLDKDVEKIKTELAREIVAVRGLSTETAELRAAVETEKTTLVKRGEEIKDATERVKSGSTFISVPEAKSRLQKDVAIHVQKSTTLGYKEKSLAEREKVRDALQKQLDEMVRQKQEMLAEIDAVEAEFKAVQLAQIESKHQFDDSRLSKIKEKLRGIRTEVEVAKETGRLNEVYAPKLEEKVALDPGTTVDEILAPLSGKK